MPETLETIHLEDLWNEEQAKALVGNQLSLLRYRSNLLGADLRITNFGGGNTSSKIEFPDPFTRKPVRVLAVKGSGGDLGSIQDSGFALLYLDRLEELKRIYRGEEREVRVGAEEVPAVEHQAAVGAADRRDRFAGREMDDAVDVHAGVGLTPAQRGKVQHTVMIV